MSIQSNINQTLGVGAIIASQSPWVKERAEVRSLKRQYNNLQKYKSGLLDNEMIVGSNKAPETEYEWNKQLYNTAEELGNTAKRIGVLDSKAVLQDIDAGKQLALKAAMGHGEDAQYAAEAMAKAKSKSSQGDDMTPIDGYDKANLTADVEATKTVVQRTVVQNRRELLQQMRREGIIPKRTANKALKRLNYKEVE